MTPDFVTPTTPYMKLDMNVVYHSTEPDEQRIARDVTCLAVANAFMATFVRVIPCHLDAINACALLVFGTADQFDHTQHAYDL